ncbi:MAG: mannitol dehydrogenase family protein [Propionibacterium sp.]|nr:mannitol dehydrogenase family protein [Propionibacterium sp.]
MNIRAATSPLTRIDLNRPAAPVRIIHLGLGNFSRAHLAWYTTHAPDADRWGIAAFTGRSPDLADRLWPQNGLFHLVIRDPTGDRVELIDSLAAVHAADEHIAWLSYFADPAVCLVTSTITEAGYRSADGRLATSDPAVAADLAILRGDPAGPVGTAPAKFVAGLLARRDAGAGGISFCPCDNMPRNGDVVATVIRDAAEAVDPTLTTWIDEHVTFVTTMVDRITPRPDPHLGEFVAQVTGFADRAAVETEPFSEWVLSGRFAAGRPAWDAAGARFVDDIAPFERRKLHLLNGAHTLTAYPRPLLGCETVRDAIGHPVVGGWVEQWWTEARRSIGLPAPELDAYTDALRARFANPRIRHLLTQIGADGSQKVPIRILPVLRAERDAGRPGDASCRAVAAWVLHLRAGDAVHDSGVSGWDDVRTLPLPEAVARVLRRIGVYDPDVARLVVTLAEEMT